ncbi:MAG: bifunctional riboflavin kinase/FAD synthetase [Bacteroidales bacterium]|jgi:riboflavin kinase/FMN adenylyltransferase|nr:bifunctional riboflavin kinase/FAD synthetase [Bacteroidales bacterium]
MNIYNGTRSFQVDRPILTVGSFDGVHLGHIKVLSRLTELAHRHNGVPVVFTFAPHPRQILFPDEKMQLLTTTDEKIVYFQRTGINHLIIYPFTKEFASMNYADFVHRILVEQLHIRALVVGHDHRFGANREGAFERLLQLSAEQGFVVEQSDALAADGTNISSTCIRRALMEGRLDRANHCLGYNYSLCGTVVKGRQLGRQLGFPTANIRITDPAKLIPASGVYGASVHVDGQRYCGMLNIGRNPSVGQPLQEPAIEVHILNFDGNLYGHDITVELVFRLRDEQKFTSIEALRNRLKADRLKIVEALEHLCV